MLPSALAYLQIASSLALGTVLAAALIIGLSSPQQQRYRDTPKLLQLALALVIGVGSHLLLASALRSVDFSRGLASLLPLTIFLIGGISLANLLTGTSSSVIRRGCMACLMVFGIVALFSIFDLLQPANIGYEKPVFPFSEPSHFAIISLPFLIFTCTLVTPTKRALCLVAAAVVAASLQNLTLFVSCAVTALLCLPLRYIVVAAAIATPILLTADITYYLSRVEFSADSQNLSALVYMQGWQLLLESLENTHGFGLGFQQLGVAGTDVEASDLILALFHDHLNLLDGGFTLSKIGSELGVIGLGLIAAFSFLAIRAGLLLRSIALRKSKAPAAVVLAASVITGYTVELVIRGVGYFTPSGLFLIASLIIWHRYRRQTASSRVPVAHRPASLVQDKA